MSHHYPLPAQKEWTEHEDGILLDGWSKGLTAGQLTARLPNRTRSAVMGRVFRLRLADRPSPIPGRRPRMPKEPAPPVPKLPVREARFVLLPEPAARQALADQAYMRAIACAAGTPRA